MIVNTSLAALAAGDKVELVVGDVLRVSCSFSYIVSEAVIVILWASLGLGLGRDIETREETSLEAALTPKTWEGSIDIEIPSVSIIPFVGIKSGTYWLRAEIEGYPETQTTIPDAVIISAAPSIFDMIGPLLVMGLMMAMMAMIMPKMKEGFG